MIAQTVNSVYANELRAVEFYVLFSRNVHIMRLNNWGQLYHQVMYIEMLIQFVGCDKLG